MRTHKIRRFAAACSVALTTVASFGIEPAQAASVSAPGCAATVGDASTATLTRVDANCVLTFTSGSNTFSVPSGMTSVRALVVGGGGGGGHNGGGGGGGGAVTHNATLAVTPGSTENVVVGAAGAAPGSATSAQRNAAGGQGGTSSFGALTAAGGGGGGTRGSTPSANAGQPGYSGGGGGGYGSVGGSGTSGANGGNGIELGCDSTGGGGGGASGASGTNGAYRLGGNGGAGVGNNITGTTQYYGGGGAGGGTCDNSQTQTWSGTPGTGGGASASRSAAANTGGGGGGGGAVGWSCYGGAGGSGVVILAWPGDPIPPFATAIPTISGTAQRTQTLSASIGTWSQSPSGYSYQWKRATSAAGTYTNIPGASGLNYTLTSDDVDMYIKFEVSATNVNGSNAEISTATAKVTDLPLGTAPVLSSTSSTDGGFTFTISNFGSLGSYNIAVATTNGTVSHSSGNVTVTGLGSAVSATVTVTTSRSGYRNASTTATGTSNVVATTSTSSTVPPTTTTAAPIGQAAVATIAPTTNSIAATTNTTTPVVRSATATTTTSTSSTTTTTLPNAPKVDPGEASLTVGGEAIDATITRSNDQLVVSAGEMTATVSGRTADGSIAPLDADGNIHLNDGDSIALDAEGFGPESEVEVWLFSTPTRLGVAKVGTDGTISASFPLPAGVSSGHHRIVLSGVNSARDKSVFAVGIVFGKQGGVGTVGKVLIVTPLVAAIMAALVLPARRRRKGLLA